MMTAPSSRTGRSRASTPATRTASFWVPRQGLHIAEELAVRVQGEVDLVAEEKLGVALGPPAGVGIDEADDLVGVARQHLGHDLASRPDLGLRARNELA